MGRHSKNSTDKPYCTQQERADQKWGSHIEKVDGDAQLPFGFCALSSHAPKDPVSTPHGVIYDKEYILEHLVKSRKEAQEKLILWDKQEKRKESHKASVENEESMKEALEFEKQELGGGASSSVPGKVDTMMHGASQTYLHADKTEARAISFWVRENQLTAKAKDLEKPSMATKCPMTGKKLKMKDLIPVKLERIDEKGQEQRGMFCCAVTKRAIVHQQAILLKPSGIVVDELCLKDIVKPSMTCPVTSKRLIESDLIKLRRGGSGFSSHSVIEKKQYCFLSSKANEGGTRMSSIRTRY